MDVAEFKAVSHDYINGDHQLKALDGMGSPIEGIIIVKSKDIFCFSTDELPQ
ncbi:hypothetical protein H8692_02285 [Mogibacterium sp. NSJ-24]|jgi:hypothetical protein|uniref:Uncharacterized protein n=1 Tax=Lentihominibacter hominis TaxID=2763645 RepID=A0A926E8B2_9FIRM|nr:hypothetical protein [Lentihominibacter hominis]MBC8567589.1 hypothetical protein [Lentihominibacter hominis]